MVYLIALAFILGGGAHKLYLHLKKKPEPKNPPIFEIGDHISALLDGGCHCTGTFHGWLILKDGEKPMAKIILDQGAKENTCWFIDPKAVTFIRSAPPSFANPEKFLN